MIGKPVALVTGGSRGIGAAISEKLAGSGYEVAVLARGRETLEAFCARIGGHAFVCDVTDRAAVDRALAAVVGELGAPSVLVNNAGYGGPFHRADEVSDEEWEQVFATNIRSTFWFTRACLPAMREAGYGRVINIASIMGLAGGVGSSAYAASKHAVVGYTKAVAAEFGRFGVTCNAVCPGYVQTDMVSEGHGVEGLKSRIPVGRLGTPEEVAGLVGFLAGREAGYMNGAVVTMDGGMLAYVG